MINYLKKRKLLMGMVIYVVVATLLHKFLSVNIFIPCLWTTCFHIQCPGCGITTAFLELISFNILAAYKINPMIFVITGISIYLIVKDYNTFRKGHKKRGTEVGKVPSEPF